MIEMVIWILVGVVSFVTGVWFISELDPSSIEPLSMKAYVFSKIMESRYKGGRVVVDSKGVLYNGEKREFDVDCVISASMKGIYYVGSMIRSAGTVCTKRGNVSFSPVTGRMVVRVR